MRSNLGWGGAGQRHRLGTVHFPNRGLARRTEVVVAQISWGGGAQYKLGKPSDSQMKIQCYIFRHLLPQLMLPVLGEVQLYFHQCFFTNLIYEMTETKLPEIS